MFTHIRFTGHLLPKHSEVSTGSHIVAPYSSQCSSSRTRILGAVNCLTVTATRWIITVRERCFIEVITNNASGVWNASLGAKVPHSVVLALLLNSPPPRPSSPLITVNAGMLGHGEARKQLRECHLYKQEKCEPTRHLTSI